MNNCIFCKIIDKEVPTELIYESDTVLAFEDIQPMAPVHILIIPREHIASMNDIDNANSKIVADMFEVAVKIAKEQGIADDGYKLLIRIGKDSGQEVSHIHLHLIGGAPLSEGIHPIKK